MHTPTITGLRLRDEIGMPASGEPVVARARRDESYVVHVVRDAEALRERLSGFLDGVRTVALVTDTTVETLHGPALLRSLRAHDVDVVARVVPAGERTKSLPAAVEMWNWLAHTGLGRRDLVVNFGGGVINDMGGWVASAYMRGVPYLNLPTTLMAMVDGALGGKVAVNHPVAKNLLGAFQQPVGVVSNVGYLQTLERRHLAAGIAECVKKGVIASPEYFAFIEDHADALLGGDLGALARLVAAASAIKTTLIARDPYEEDLRRPLNFGHTVGHPLETVTGYGPLLHGEAVAFGMAVEARVAAARGWLPASVLDRLLSVLSRCGLPVAAAELPVTVRANAIVAAMDKVRLIRAGSLRWVLPLELGDTAIADDVSEVELRSALGECGVR